MDDIARAEAEISMKAFIKEVQEAASKWGVRGELKMDLQVPVSTEMGDYRRNGVEAANLWGTFYVSDYPELHGSYARVRWGKATRKIEEWEVE